jgi:hypothetical protein
MWDDARVNREGVRGRELRLGCAVAIVPTLIVAIAILIFADEAAAKPFLPTPATLPLSGEQPRVAIGDDGQIVAVWMHGFRNGTTSGTAPAYNNEVAAATGSALSGLWQMPVLISAPGFSILPEVAIDAHGDAAAVWLDSYPGKNTIDASYRAASSGVWQPPVTVSVGEHGTDQHVLVEPDGDALVWWAKLGEGEGAGIAAYKAAFRPAATGVWGPPREFAAGRHPGGLRLALDARGDVFAAWVSEGAVETDMLPLGSASWDAPVTVAPAPAPPDNVERVQLAVSPDGNAAALWQQVDKQCPRTTWSGQPGTAACVVPVTLRSSVRSAVTGAWSAPEEIPNAPRAEPQAPARGKIAAPAVLPLGDQDLQIAVDSAGDAVATWAQFEATKAGLEVSVRPASTHVWQTPAMLSPTNGDFAFGARYLAVDDFGRALVTWDANGVIQGSVGSAATGAWQEPVDMTPEEGNLAVGEPHAAVDATGDAVLVWVADGPPASSMQAITFNLSTGVPGYRPPLALITNATLTNRRFRVAGPRRRRRASGGTRFRFTVFPDAWVNVAIEELRPGHRAGARCAASSEPVVRALRANCLVASVVTNLESREGAGPRSIFFSGTFQRKVVRLEGTKAPLGRIVSLKPGRYAAVLTATNTSGTSAPVTLRFTVAR